MRKPARRPLGIYLHVPFCRQKCAYCDFYSLPRREDAMEDYVRAVCAHLAEVAPSASLHQVDTVYFGGGTPSYLGVRHLKTILSAVQKYYQLSRDAEITLEANPDSAGDWRALHALRKAGFNRISLGMQSALNSELRAVGRIHTFDQVEQAVEAARKAKFKNLSLDLIYGLPNQSRETFSASLCAAAALSPEHISCYGLKLEENTPLYASRARLSLADDDAQADLYLSAVSFLTSLGYEQYEISNFAKPGCASRHNLKYWTLGEYAGFGPGAHSDFGGVRYSFAPDLDSYVNGMLRGGTLKIESETLPEWTRDTEYIMLGLRTAAGIEARHYENTYRQRFSVFLPLLEKYARSGWAVETAPGRWRLTAQGFLLSNSLINGLLGALAEDKRIRMEAAARGDFFVRR